jgi:hypothetical protein
MRRYPDGTRQTSVGGHSGRKCGKPAGCTRAVWFNHFWFNHLRPRIPEAIRIVAAPKTVMPRAGGASSTPRPIDSITAVSGILGRPVRTSSRAMTTEYAFAISRRDAPEAGPKLSPKEGAGKTGCALHPRSRVQWHKEVRTRAYRSSGEHPAFPAQWFDGLWRALPGDEFLLPPSLPDCRPNEPGWIRLASASLTPATGARTTRFCRTQQRRSSCADRLLTASSTKPETALQCLARAGASRPPQPALHVS